ncbi:MAG: carboxymuconolactone decarboxylase family protein [Planctomycetota bacterium]
MDSLQALQARLPDFAKDLRLNLGAIPTIESLDVEQLWGTVLASAYATGGVLPELVHMADERLSPEASQAARTAASVMGMNNIYYRFVHLATNPTYGQLPARLRMQGIKTHGVEQANFELWALAVSAIHGCGACIDSHERVLLRAGLVPTAIQDAVRIAAIVHGAAQVVTTERALATVPVA